MPRYRVNYVATASCGIVVEADSPDEAYDLAEQEGTPGLCAYCAGVGQRGPGIDIGDWQPDEEYPHDVLDDA